MFAGFPGLASNSEGSKRVEPTAVAVRSTVTILSGVRLSWSSLAPEGIVIDSLQEQAEFSRTVVKLEDAREVVYYVDFS